MKTTMAKTRSRTKKETAEKRGKMAPLQNTAAVAPYDDVVFEILVRLPARSVGRFRCVSKSWLSIATDSAFVRSHIRYSRAARQSLLILRPGRGGRFFFASASNTPAGITLCKLAVPTTSFITATCDGLVCYYATGQYNIFNPLTGTGSPVISLTEKSHQTCFLGFFFHHSTSEYRLLAAAQEETYLLVVGGNSWKQISCRIPAFCDHSHTADLNGCLHWLAWKQKPQSADGRYSAPPDIIMTFDKESEVYGLVSLQLPEKLCDRSSNLLNFKGELGLWVADDFGIDLWVLESAECWVKKHSVNYDDASGSLPFLEAPPRLAWLIGVAVSIGDEELFVDISVSERLHCLVLWNLKSGGYLARIWKTSYALVLTTFSHMESLFNPN